MSGGLLTPASEPLLEARTCYLCRDEYRDARMLVCCHSFCAGCLRDRVLDMALLCPICGHLTKLEGTQLPPADPVLGFLIEAAHENKPLCANCDLWADTMYFCNTCSQPLCGECRQSTHQAKMFASHQVGPMTLRTRDVYTSCHIHGEPYILFSAERKSMLCINCFRDLSIESRPFCIDLDTAYSQSCHLVDQTVQNIREVERTIQDGILLLGGLLQEVKHNAEQERVAILTLYSDITEKIAAKRDNLLEDVERQAKSKDRQFSEQLKQLSCLLPTVQNQLQVTGEFSSTANKYEFLELAYRLMDRLSHILPPNQQLQPSQDGSITTNHRAQFARSLDSLLSLKPVSPSLSPASSHSHPDYTRSDCVDWSPTASSTITFTSDGGRKINGSSGVNKVIMIESNGVFANHFKELENKHREVVQRFESVKGCVQELQRDMTLRRCLAKSTKVTELLNRTAKIDDDIVRHLESAEKQRPLLEKHWEIIYHQVADEQEVYQAQVNDILRMRQEAQHLGTIVKKLAPFVKSIAKVTEHLSPRLGEMARESEKGHQMQELLDRINTLEPDSQHRVEAIRSTEEERQLQASTRVNPLDDELIRTKGLLKSPSVRMEREARAKRNRQDSENRADHGENRADHGENRADHGDNIADHGDNRADHGDNRADHGDNRADHGDNRADHSDSIADHRDNRADHGDSRPDQEENRPDHDPEMKMLAEAESCDLQDCDLEDCDLQNSDLQDCVCGEKEWKLHSEQVESSDSGGCDRNSTEDTIAHDQECKNTTTNRYELDFMDKKSDEITAVANTHDLVNSDQNTEQLDYEDSDFTACNKSPTNKINAGNFEKQDSCKTKEGASVARSRRSACPRELRKCNSLGRGGKNESADQQRAARKFSFDLGGISADELALRSLLHDAILARAEQRH